MSFFMSPVELFQRYMHTHVDTRVFQSESMMISIVAFLC